MAPILGYPTLAYACAALRAEGLHYRAIAARVGRTEGQVRASLCSLDHAKKPRTLVLPVEMVAALSAPAAARGIDVPELALQLLDTIARDEVTDALLGEPSEWRGAGDA
jgi:hypothetical protein